MIKTKFCRKKLPVFLAVFVLCSSFYAQEAADGFVVPLNEDFSKVLNAPVSVATNEESSSKSKVLQGLWIEATSHNNSLIRNISDGTKKGYEFDNSHFTSEANWWFWGDLNQNFHLDAEISVWKFDKTLYQANSYGSNVPDVTWGDGLQSFASMFFSPLKEMNDNGVGSFNKFSLNLAMPFIQARVGYGNLKAGGMSKFKGIFTVIDRWDDVGDGYMELKNGASFKQIGDFTIDALVALSEMRDSYGTYDYLDIKYSDKAEIAFTFGSTTTEEKLFYYNKANTNAFSGYAALTPIESLKIEGHYLGTFGTNVDLNGASSAGAGKLSFNGETWNISLMQSIAGENVNSVWGSDNASYDDINADTATTQIDFNKNFGLSKLNFTLGLDQGVTLNDSDNLSEGLMELRSQPYADFELGSVLGKDISLAVYGVFGFDRLAKGTSEDRETIFSFEEAAFEITATEIASYLKKLTFDYGVNISYKDWLSGSSYPLNKAYHSFMTNAQITDKVNVHAGAIVRYADNDDTNVPFAFSCGAKINNIPIFGKPHFWIHFTYGMNPYEDNNYSLYRADDPLNKSRHRTYLLNALDENTTISQISCGLIWDL